jgi:hypothetical protein
MSLLTPTISTLRRYGLSIEEWRAMATAQDHVCYICNRLPPSNRLCIDHAHIPKWKKLPPEKRKLYVRGLLCSYCNLRLLPKGMTLSKAKSIVTYLEAFKSRLDTDLSKHTQLVS